MKTINTCDFPLFFMILLFFLISIVFHDFSTVLLTKKTINRLLKHRGIVTWFDEEQMEVRMLTGFSGFVSIENYGFPHDVCDLRHSISLNSWNDGKIAPDFCNLTSKDA